MLRLRVLAGTSTESLVPITDLVNTDDSYRLSSDLFEGRVSVNIKGFTDDRGQIKESSYFQREDKQGITWSIQVQGRLLVPYSADDILFGNTFEKPLRLPWGSSAALKFMKFIDPVLEHDLTSQRKPWALSPLIATMPHFAHQRLHPSRHSSVSSSCSRFSLPDNHSDNRRAAPPLHSPPLPVFPPIQSISDDLSQLHQTLIDRSPDSSGSGSSSASSSNSSLASTSSKRSVLSSFSSKAKQASKKARRTSPDSLFASLRTSSDRRSHFSNCANRQSVEFGPNDLITTDFCYGFLEFNPSLSLCLPGGISFDLMRYWDGQPVRFVCCERAQDSGNEDGDPWGRTFWCIVIELAE